MTKVPFPDCRTAGRLPLRRFDLAVVGSGLAAAVAASCAVRAGMRVVVLRRPGPPPGFGEVIDPSGMNALHEAGLEALALPALGEAVEHLLLRWPPRETERMQLPGQGRIVVPERLTAIVFAHAAQAGACLVEAGASGVALERAAANQRWRLGLPDRSGTRSVDHVIDASGQGAWASAHGLVRRVVYRHLGVHVVGQCLSSHGRNRSSMTISAQRDGWLYRLAYHGPRIAGGLFFLPAAATPARFASAVQRLLSAEGSAVYGAVCRRPVSSQLSFADSCHGPAWTAIGAAALGLDPLSGQGMGWAMESAGYAVQGCLVGGDRHAASARYRDFWRARCREALDAASAHYGEAAKAFRTPFWTETYQALAAFRLGRSAAVESAGTAATTRSAALGASANQRYRRRPGGIAPHNV